MCKLIKTFLFVSLVFAFAVSLTFSCECGREKAVSRVVGGKEAIPYSYPWLVSIIDADRDPYCGGSMINKDYVLTAAHCLVDTVTREERKQSEIRIVLGAHDLYKRRETLTFRVDTWKIHPNFKSVDNYDIALIKLKFPNEQIRQKLIPKIMPVCLPRTEFTNSDKFTVVGWGRTKTKGLWSRKLLEARVQGSTLDECRSKFEDEDLITERHLCAGNSKRDSCEGDSGGPLMQKKAGRQYLMGIASFGEECAHAYKPGIYTRVYSYIDWIRKNINDTTMCN